MIIQYSIVVTIINLVDNVTKRFSKIIEDKIEATTDDLLYNNYHVLSDGTYILDIFAEEVNDYCVNHGIQTSSVEVDEFEIVSLTDRVDVFFESPEGADNSLSLRPFIKAYVYPKHDELKVPKLIGVAYDDTTIIWSWPEDEMYAHYLVEEAIDPTDESSHSKVIAQIPIGMSTYTETGLQPDTPYTRRLINYTDEQTSVPSSSVTVRTETVEIEKSLSEYNVAKNYDFTTDDSEREVIQERLAAFHSGVGDFNDLKVYKQMDVDFYQKFKAYFEISGRRFEREKRYEQIGFNYKICLEALEEVEEQEGEVTFDVEAYPREWVAIEDYIWGTAPVIVKTRLKATVFLRKPIESEETVEEKLYKPKFKPHYETVTIFNETSLILSLDCSTSQRKIVNDSTGATRRDVMVEAAKLLIDNFESIAPGQLEYVIVGWAGNSHVEVFSPGNADKAKKSIDTISIKNDFSEYEGYNLIATVDATHFEDGLTAGKDKCSFSRIGQIFFTDGFCNYGNGVKGWGRYDELNYHNNNFKNASCDEVIKSITEGFNAAEAKTFVVFGAYHYEFDPDFSEWKDTEKGNRNLAFQKEVYEHIINNKMNSSNYFGYIQGNMDNGDASDLASKLAEGVKLFEQHEVLTGYDFDGWEEYTVDAPPVVKYDLDDVKQVTVQTEIYSFAFLHNESQKSQIPAGIPYGVTPAKYVRTEKRTIIPSSSFLKQTPITSDNLYTILLDLAKETDVWKSGYNQTIGTVETEGEPDKFLIANLYIQDTYNFADEDEVTETNWGIGTYEDGMEGSVNVFTEIDKMDTSYYGDNCYLVENSDKSKLFVQGYTDALIYDYMMYVREELNKHDRESEILAGPSITDNNWLTNRKKPSLTYPAGGGVDLLNHVIDLIEKDDDIWIDNFPAASKPGWWEEIYSMSVDFIAHNDTWHTSPVLNYRFNLEDPDAKTSLYEIMPGCNPKSDYLHVVILHVYYAKNVWITNKSNYHGEPESWMNIISYKGDPCLGVVGTDIHGRPVLSEGLYQWTQKDWQHGFGKDNGWYIDEYVWFMAKPMIKIQDYYDELPGIGAETFYGLVNGRYRTDTPSGRKDLTVQTPRFNIPTTVTEKHGDSIRIYAIITEISPDTGLISYKWETPWNNINGITQKNGDYIYFSSDSMTYKDVEYLDVISTINFENQEIFDNKTTEKIFTLQQPETIHEYQNYYLNVITNNGDVLALRYPTEIEFVNGIAEVGVAFKGIVNATSKWSPRIHNGYYYLNQHEHFAYSEFDVDANFDTYNTEDYKTIAGYVNIEVNLVKTAKPEEKYSIVKATRSELLQDEDKFVWVDDKGLTLKPVIDGEYYKQYTAYQYISPKITFDNKLTEADTLTVHLDYSELGIASFYVPMEIRSYDIDTCTWTEWSTFVNGTVPPVLSNAYQLRFILEAEVTYSDKVIEDYKCCYLDWKDDQSEQNLTNIVTITDYMTTGPDDAKGTYISKIFDYGCNTEISMDIYESNYKAKVGLFIAASNDKEELLLENITWVNISASKDTVFKARYFRYKFEIPANEKVYWLHQKITTKEAFVSLPYITKITMNGSYKPQDEKTNFINIESFEIRKDGNYHEVIPNLLNIIGADVVSKGYEYSHIETVKILSTTAGVRINYDSGVDAMYPNEQVLKTPIYAFSDIDVGVSTNKTPYIRVDDRPSDGDPYNKELDVITIHRGTPQQYCPITVEDETGQTYIHLLDCDKDMYITDTYVMDKSEKYIEMKRNYYELDTICIYINDELVSDSYKIVNHLLIFDYFLNTGDVVTVKYRVNYSFYSIVDREKDMTVLLIYSDSTSVHKYKVYFETGKINNKFVAERLSLNPIYRTDYKGFIYLTDEHNEPYKVNIYCNPLRLKAGGYDRVDIQIEVLDIHDNPVISKPVAVDCTCGIITCEDYNTDMNGVVHLIYESSVLPAEDIVKARVETDHNTVIEQSICIINE